jgi:hypothetical protein
MTAEDKGNGMEYDDYSQGGLTYVKPDKIVLDSITPPMSPRSRV